MGRVVRVVRGLEHYVICAIKIWQESLCSSFVSRVRGDVQMVSV